MTEGMRMCCLVRAIAHEAVTDDIEQWWNDNDKRRNEELVGKPVPLPLRPPHGLA
jgi:hypothetical protein